MKAYDASIEKPLIDQLPIGSVWEHYRSTQTDPRRYEIVGYCRNETTTALCVLYKPLYKGEFPSDIPWAREATDFLASLDDGRPRFQRIEADRSSNSR